MVKKSTTSILPADSKVWSSLMDVEANLFELERQHQEEERALAEKYFKQKSGYYKQRNDLVKEIPNFWLTALENHTVLGNLLEVNDLEILKYLTDIIVDRPMSGHVKIMFEFSPNPFFQETVLMKEYITETEEQVKVVNYPITWTQNDEFTRSTCFIQFFANQELDLGEIIVDDLYPNAFKFFQGMMNDEEEYVGEQENPDVTGGIPMQQEILQETIAPAQAEGGDQQ